jgi:hypothetical protein
MHRLTWALALSLLGSLVVAGAVQAQSIIIGPGGVRIEPEAPPPPQIAPAPREPEFDRRSERRDEVRERMLDLRERCEDGDRRACVRFGIIIGENRERRAQWRHENPEAFWWERER